MSRLMLVAAAIASLTGNPAVIAQEPTAQNLAASLRAFLLPHVPNPLYEKRDNWNHTIEATSRIGWQGQGLETKPKNVKSQKNHGIWKHVLISSPNVVSSQVRFSDTLSRALTLPLNSLMPRSHFCCSY